MTIPKIINLFWAGKAMDDTDAEHVLTFLKNAPPGWQVFLWLTNKESLLNTLPFKRFANYHLPLPKQLVMKDIRTFLQSFVPFAFDHQDKELFLQSKLLVLREMVGLGNFAAAKDGMMPMILYRYGGYFFDLDAVPTEIIKTVDRAPYGFLTIYNGHAPCALAATRGHLFCKLALKSLIDNYRALPEIIQHVYQATEKYQHYSATFFNNDILRNRNHSLRPTLTCMTSGTIIRAALVQYAKLVGQSLQDDKFKNMVNFELESPRRLRMGVIISNNKKEVEKKQPDQSFFKHLWHQACYFFKKKPPVTPSLKKKNWRDQQHFQSFTTEQILKY